MNPALEHLVNRPATWLERGGPSGRIVVSTRARLARNLGEFPFPHHASGAVLSTVWGQVERGLMAHETFAQAVPLRLEDLDPLERRYLQECHLVSPQLIQQAAGRGVVVLPDLSRGVMVNEEDHLRLSALTGGFNPRAALQNVLALDDALDRTLTCAFQEDLGYLCASPANTGTGLRLSVLVHLPGLVLADEIGKILNALRQLRFTVQGLYGSGSTVRGALFQISSMVALGKDEDEIAGDFEYHLGKVILHEDTARRQLLDRDSLGIEDNCRRSLAVLSHARLMTSQEAFDRLSQVMLGASLGLVEEPVSQSFYQTLIGQQTAHLEVGVGRSLAGQEKSAVRADYLRRVFSGA